MKKLLLLFLGLCIVTYAWYLHELMPVGGPAGPVRVKIDPGTTVDAVATLLADKGVIRSPFAFKIFVKLHAAEARLQAGTFVLRASMDTGEVVEVLRTGKTEELSLTIPEGWTVQDLDLLLAAKGLAASGAVMDCLKRCDFATFDFLPPAAGLAARGGRLEGYLFPETYFVSEAEFVPKFFLERMLGTFRSRVIAGHEAEVGASGHSLHQIITMASLVEAETRTVEERPIVAGILWKRLKQGMPLGVDATVRYIVQKPTEEITQTDLQSASPYNTRKFRGLPPGPIESPSMASILAALHPQESPYWFYLHDGKGSIHYAVTNEEHNENRAKYLR